MICLIHRIEKVMREINPYKNPDEDYYYEANNMMRLLPYFTIGKDNVLDLCMDAFQIYDNGDRKWVNIASKIHVVLHQQVCANRTKRFKEELMMKVFHPDRVERWLEQGYEF